MGRLAYACRRDVGTPQSRAEARRDMSALKLESAIQDALAAAPPLTDEQRARLARTVERRHPAVTPNGKSPGGLPNPQDPQLPTEAQYTPEGYPMVVGGSRSALRWTQKATTWEEFVERLDQPGTVKDCGG